MNRKSDSDKNKRGKLYYSFQAISMVPLLLYGIVVIIFSSTSFRHSMQEQVYTELRNVAFLVDTLLDTAYPGDYSLVDGKTLSLYKGDVNITSDYTLIDGIRERLDRRIFGYTRVFGQDYSLHPVQPSQPLRAHLAGGQAEEAGRHHQKAQPLGHLRRNPLRPDPL